MSVKRYEANGSSSVFEDASGSLVEYEDYAALEQKLTDMAVQLANAESKCRELAAENAKKSRCLGFFASVIKSGESWTRVCQHEYNEAQETPAADAFLAEVRAQGVDAAMEHMQSSGSLTFGDCYISLNEFAAQLRKGVQS
ncbi:hypothetical protein I5449_01540 [Citrobacter sp. FDAARGOS_156]|uniref:hypothetical protein n=1 Tax=Citrobacter sp. FDAARGOS_156 TaxID=1702170 RepID=UPI0019025395|nr:hypothetical protein [Citrobacter sp. FDAARGOS_156]MBJ9110071.1 hypothetical protein [Citrobacter sp. FDAARGOS_156]